MADAKHTQGSLTVQRARGADREGEVGILLDGKFLVAECWADIRRQGEQALDEAMANATLYAAASDLLEAARAAVAYDDALFACADDPRRMSSFCTAEGDDLDALYARWMSKSRAAIIKATGRAA